VYFFIFACEFFVFYFLYIVFYFVFYHLEIDTEAFSREREFYYNIILYYIVLVEVVEDDDVSLVNQRSQNL